MRQRGGAPFLANALGFLHFKRFISQKLTPSMSYQYWSMICLVVAAVALCLELFLPSAGILGLIAVALMVASISTAFLHSLYFGALIVFVIVVATPFLFAAAVRIWPHTPIGKSILIGDRNKEDVLPKGSYYKRVESQAGQTGTAKTKMYPSGIVLIDGEPFDAVSNGFPIEAGDRIRVISVKGNRLHVQKIQDDETQSPTDTSTKEPTKDKLTQTMEDLGMEDFDLDAPQE